MPRYQHAFRDFLVNSPHTRHRVRGSDALGGDGAPFAQRLCWLLLLQEYFTTTTTTTIIIVYSIIMSLRENSPPRLRLLALSFVPPPYTAEHRPTTQLAKPGTDQSLRSVKLTAGLPIFIFTRKSRRGQSNRAEREREGGRPGTTCI